MTTAPGSARRSGGGGKTETKASRKTTELLLLVVVAVGIMVASKTISSEDGQVDWFRADQAWLYMTVLATVYMVSRGLAKSGSRAPHAPRAGAAEDIGAGGRVEDVDAGKAERGAPARPVTPPPEGGPTESPWPAPSGDSPRQEVAQRRPDDREDRLEPSTYSSASNGAELRAERTALRSGTAAASQRHDEEERTSGSRANLAITLGGVGLVALVVTFGALFFVALPLGLAAMVLARRASRASERLPGAPGSGRARVAWALGLLTSLLSALVLALVVLGVTVIQQLN